MITVPVSSWRSTSAPSAPAIVRYSTRPSTNHGAPPATAGPRPAGRSPPADGLDDDRDHRHRAGGDADEPDADHLAEQQRAGPHDREQHLADPVGLLDRGPVRDLDHEHQQHEVQDERHDDREPRPGRCRRRRPPATRGAACAGCRRSRRVESRLAQLLGECGDASAWRVAPTSVSFSPLRTITTGIVARGPPMSTSPSSTSLRARAAGRDACGSGSRRRARAQPDVRCGSTGCRRASTRARPRRRNASSPLSSSLGKDHRRGSTPRGAPRARSRSSCAGGALRLAGSRALPADRARRVAPATLRSRRSDLSARARRGIEEQLRERRRLDPEVVDARVGTNRVEDFTGIGAGRRRRRVPLASTVPISAAAWSIHDGSTATSTRSQRFGLDALSCLTSPCRTTRPRLSSVIDSHRSSTRSSWWLENNRLPPARVCSRMTSDRKLDRDGVEARERLVEHEQLRVVHHRRRELHPLRHSAGQPRDLVARAVARSSCSSRSRAALSPVCRSSPCRRAIQTSRSSTRISRYRPRSCGMYPHAARSASVAGRPCHSTVPESGVEHSEQDPHERRLPGSVRPEETDHRPAGRRDPHRRARRDPRTVG